MTIIPKPLVEVDPVTGATHVTQYDGIGGYVNVVASAGVSPAVVTLAARSVKEAIMLDARAAANRPTHG